MTIFDVKPGERVHVTTETVNAEMPDIGAKGMIKTNMSYWATATDRYQTIDGVRRRLFVDADVNFGFGRDIWLSDGPVIGGARAAPEEEWPEIIS